MIYPQRIEGDHELSHRTEYLPSHCRRMLWELLMFFSDVSPEIDRLGESIKGISVSIFRVPSV